MGTLLENFFGFGVFAKELQISPETEHLDRLSAQLDCRIESLEFLYKASETAQEDSFSEIAIPTFRARLLADQL